MLYSVFDLQELVLQKKENIEFAKYAMKNLPTIFITHSVPDTVIKDIKRKYGFNDIMSDSREYESLSAFIGDNTSRIDDWFIIFVNEAYEHTNYGNQFVFCPYEFWGSMNQFDDKSFTEHAKKKLLYNELSWLYMESIANDTDREVALLKMIFNQFKIKNILDSCCGIGRHSRRLAELGFKVTGVDASKNQIETALKQNYHQNVRYYVSDVRNFKLEEKFEACICMWTTYNYFSKEKDIKEFLDNMYIHLTDKAILVLDSKNIPILDSRRLYQRRTERKDIDLTLLVYKRIIGMIQNSQYFYFIKKGSEKEFYIDEEFVRFYSLQELEELNRNRFRLLNVYGDFYGNPYNMNSSERMITVWEKT